MCRLLKFTFSVITFLHFSLCFISAQEFNTKSTELANRYLLSRGEVIIRFIKPERISMPEITSILSVDNIHTDTVIAYTNEEGFNRFLSWQIPYEVLQPPSLNAKAFIQSEEKLKTDWWNYYPSFPAFVALMEKFVADYPGLCSLKEFGITPNGHPLLALNISDQPGVSENEPVVFYSSTIHGDETLGFMLTLRLIDYLLENYSHDTYIRKLLDHLEIWINPLANPDGTYFLSDSSVLGAKRFNSNNIDLNRDFPDVRQTFWTTADRQPETEAMMVFMEGIWPSLSANFHGGAEVVNYPWDTWPYLHADDAWFRNISRAYADTAQYYGDPGYMTDYDNGITNGYAWYPVFGGRQDYVTFLLKGREVTMEISSDKLVDESTLEGYWQANKQSLLQFIGQALTGFTGMVTDHATSMPLEASIKVLDYDNEDSFVNSSGQSGTYFRLIREGSYAVEISSPGYYTQTVLLEVREGELSALEEVRLLPLSEHAVFPNPFTTLVNIYIPESGGEMSVTVYDLSGRKIQYTSKSVAFAGVQQFGMENLGPGIYVLEILHKSTLFRQKVIKIRK